MKKFLCVLCVFAILSCFCSCNDDNSHIANEYETMKTSITKDSVKEFMSLMEKFEPSGLISGYEINEKNCYNVTPVEVAAETNMKIFKFSDSCASFVMLDGEIYTLCDWFGGYGFVNAVPCDFDEDGNKDLLVASSSGSGIHCSVISVFNSVSKESTVLYNTMTTDLMVTRSTADSFTNDSEIDEKPYYSILSVKIDVANNNFADLGCVVIDAEGYIEYENNNPKFIPYQE